MINTLPATNSWTNKIIWRKQTWNRKNKNNNKWRYNASPVTNISIVVPISSHRLSQHSKHTSQKIKILCYVESGISSIVIVTRRSDTAGRPLLFDLIKKSWWKQPVTYAHVSFFSSCGSAAHILYLDRARTYTRKDNQNATSIIDYYFNFSSFQIIKCWCQILDTDSSYLRTCILIHIVGDNISGKLPVKLFVRLCLLFAKLSKSRLLNLLAFFVDEEAKGGILEGEVCGVEGLVDSTGWFVAAFDFMSKRLPILSKLKFLVKRFPPLLLWDSLALLDFLSVSDLSIALLIDSWSFLWCCNTGSSFSFSRRSFSFFLEGDFEKGFGIKSREVDRERKVMDSDRVLDDDCVAANSGKVDIASLSFSSWCNDTTSRVV